MNRLRAVLPPDVAKSLPSSSGDRKELQSLHKAAAAAQQGPPPPFAVSPCHTLSPMLACPLLACACAASNSGRLLLLLRLLHDHMRGLAGWPAGMQKVAIAVGLCRS